MPKPFWVAVLNTHASKLGHIASSWCWDRSELRNSTNASGQIPQPQWRQVLSLSPARLVFLPVSLCPLGRMGACLLALPPRRRWLSSALLPSLESDLPVVGEVMKERRRREREVDNLSTCGCMIQLYLWENTRFIEIREFGWGFLMLTS